MPSVSEITQYINKYVVLKKNISVYEKEIMEDVEYDIDRIISSQKPPEKVISSSVTTLTAITNYYGTLYINSLSNDAKNNYLCSYVAASSILLVCNYYNESPLRDSFIKSLSFQGEILLMAFACNRFELIEACYPKIINGVLDGKMSKSLPWGGDGEGNTIPPEPQRLGVLAVEMMASEHKQTIDWASAKIPADPFYARFCKEALYSEEEQELIYWLTKLCDNHLQWVSLFLDNAERSPATGYEIKQEMLLLWPFEYQAVKNFRARHGLSTPEIDHPLLKTTMAIEHRPDFRAWNKPGWFSPLVDKIIEVNPALNFIREWF